MQRACVSPEGDFVAADRHRSSVVFTATDACGNSASFTGNFTMNTTLRAEGDLQLEFGTEFDMDVHVTVEDICGDVTHMGGPRISGGCVKPTGRYLRLYTAVDECGNVPVRAKRAPRGQHRS